MSKVYSKYKNINLGNDLIEYILKLTSIKCHCCNKILNINFYKKLDKNYYCSKKCFEFI